MLIDYWFKFIVLKLCFAIYYVNLKISKFFSQLKLTSLKHIAYILTVRIAKFLIYVANF